jgi:hypothetical protein
MNLGFFQARGIGFGQKKSYKQEDDEDFDPWEPKRITRDLIRKIKPANVANALF